MRRYALTLDLKDDDALIAQYERHHEQIWPEIEHSIRTAGIERMTIYRMHTRLFMLMEVNDHFSFERKAEMDREDPRVQDWEDLMWRYQQSLPQARPGEKWVLMQEIFDLK